MKKVSSSFAQQFICRRCEDIGDGKEGPVEVLCDEVETVKGFYCLEDRLNVSGGCETAVTARVRIGWMKFRECKELLLGRRFSLKMKGMVYRSCVRLAMLYESETWCLSRLGLRSNGVPVLINFMGPLPASVIRNDLWLRLQRKSSLEPCLVKLDNFGTWPMINVSSSFALHCAVLTVLPFAVNDITANGNTVGTAQCNAMINCYEFLFQTTASFTTNYL